jgi:hypothetical protein
MLKEIETRMQIAITTTKKPVSITGFLGTNYVDTIACVVYNSVGRAKFCRRLVSTGTD